MNEKNIKNYILDKVKTNPQDVVSNNIRELAKLWFVSETSILRIVKYLHFKTYKELQMSFYLKVAINEMTNVVNENEVNDYVQCAENVFKKCFSSLINTKKRFSLDSFLKFKEILNTKKQIIFFGVGNSYSIANMLSIALYKIGLNTHCFQSTKELIISLNYLNLDDIMFIFYSNSGETKEVIYSAKQILRKKGKFALVTSSKSKFKDNCLNKATYSFIYDVNDNEKVLFPLVSQQFSQMIFNNLLLNIILMDTSKYHEKNNLTTNDLREWNRN